MKSTETVAMILAGGQGSRLGALTKNVAKPAVPFGGKYRIIDFTLSNCSHSGIGTVGVLTQYQPFELNTYIGNGQPWDLDRNEGGVFVLPPYMRAGKSEWYRGTANAVYQNIGFIEQFSPKYVLVLSGDHIYKMHYGKMIDEHKKSGASATIAVIEVPWVEAGRFGIMNTDSEDFIVEFEEKPEQPKNNLASMGIYVFNWPVLKKYLIIDENDTRSENDFGKNIIPSMLASDERMKAYRFKGYWKDVGTVQSLWEANMDLLADPPAFDLYDYDWRIFSRNPAAPPHFVSKGSNLVNSCVSEGCSIHGKVRHSVLFERVTVGEGSIVEDSILMSGARIGKNSIVKKAIVGTGSVIGDYSYIGDPSVTDETYRCPKICTSDITLIGENITIDNFIHIGVNSMIENSITNYSIGIRPVEVAGAFGRMASYE